MARLLVVDNYDSFTWNLVTVLARAGVDCDVRRNDELTLDGIRGLDPRAILLSPGPGRPESSGITPTVVRHCLETGRPLLGVCLGMQAIAVEMGARLRGAGRILHGMASDIHHDGSGVFAGLPDPLRAGRYHSLAVDPATLPEELVVTARSDDGEVMALRHADLPVEGVQFHPESVLTGHGPRLLGNFAQRFILEEGGAPILP